MKVTNTLQALAAICLSLSLALAGCGDDDTKTPEADTSSDATTSDSTTIEDSAEDGSVDDATQPPEDTDVVAETLAISNVVVTQNPNNELAAIVTFDTNLAAQSSLSVVSESGHEVTVVPPAAYQTSHEVWVLGMRFASTYTITISATDEGGQTAAADPQTYTTSAPPADLPPISVTSTPEQMAPGFTLFSVLRTVDGKFDFTRGWYYIVDAEGEVVWTYATDSSVWDARMLENGNLLVLAGPGLATKAREIDMMGNTIWEVAAADLSTPADTFHHELYPMPNGNFLAVGTELRTIDGYNDPDNPGQTISYDVTGDPVIEFAPDGTLVNFWSAFDLLDGFHTRVNDPALFNAPSRNVLYPDAPNGVKNWAGANAVIYDEANDLIIVSYRGHDWVVAFERSTGDVVWKMGCEGSFTLTGGTGAGGCDPEWHFHQHSPQLQPDGTILMFDNGNNRPGTGPGEAEPYSRAVRYALDTSNADPAQWTASVAWEYVNDTDPQYASFTGDADMLSNGNVLVTEGGLRRSDTDPPGPGNPVLGRITEVTTADPAVEVFELTIADDTPAPAGPNDPIPAGFALYRAERLPSLYPAQ